MTARRHGRAKGASTADPKRPVYAGLPRPKRAERLGIDFDRVVTQPPLPPPTQGRYAHWTQADYDEHNARVKRRGGTRDAWSRCDDPMPARVHSLAPELVQLLVDHWPRINPQNWPDGGYAMARGVILYLAHEVIARAQGMCATQVDLGAEPEMVHACNLVRERLAELPLAELSPEHYGCFHESLCGYRVEDGKVVARTGSRSKSKAPKRTNGSHFTPPRMAMHVTVRTLAPLLKSYPGCPILSFRVCDAAVGAGAFLLAGIRYFAPWALKRGEAQTLIEAKRLVAMHCFYGVDKDRYAVLACKLALTLECRADTMPSDWLDDNIKHGDGLVGLHTREQFVNFHWKASDPEARAAIEKVYDDGMRQAVAERRARLEALKRAAGA